MRAIISGGGTAGHVTPAIAIAEIILEKEPESDILFIGREGGDENEIILRKGFKLEKIKISGLKRSFSIDSAKSILKAISALKDSKRLIKDFNPQVVIGTGGYVSWPVLRAAQRLKIANIIHESNVCPGLSVKLLASKCDRILLNFGCDEKELFSKKKNLRIVGNPLPSDIIKESKESARRKLGYSKNDFVILSFGGSGGAKAINDHALTLMKNYSYTSAGVKHVHATGKKYYAEYKEKYPHLAKGKNGCIIHPYINNMHLYMKSADLIICRCGAMTLSEIATTNAVPILIPSTNVTDNHQYKNARLFTDKGAAIMIEESELCERTLLDAVRYLENNPLIRKRMSGIMHSFSKLDSREAIYNEIISVLK